MAEAAISGYHCTRLTKCCEPEFKSREVSPKLEFPICAYTTPASLINREGIQHINLGYEDSRSFVRTVADNLKSLLNESFLQPLLLCG